MTVIQKQALVPHKAEHMYALVNDVDTYPKFLPWCIDSQIISASEYHMIASLSLALGKLTHTFTTKNTLTPENRINIQLVAGPFKSLTGTWHFQPQGKEYCTISLNMEFEFKNKLIKKILGQVFYKLVDSLVESFRERANEIYGNQTK